MYVTQGLLDALLTFASEREPRSFAAVLDVTPANQFDADLDLPDETPIFTHFYLPDAGRSVTAVFGVDLSTPTGKTAGRFVSHPAGDLSVSITDDLHEVVLVAIPPWDRTSVAAFDRSGTRQSLDVIDAEPPSEQLP